MINYKCIKEDCFKIVLEFNPSDFYGTEILLALADWEKANPGKEITYISFNNTDAVRFLREECIKEKEGYTPGSFYFKFIQDKYKVGPCDDDLNYYQIRIYYNTVVKEKIKEDMKIIAMPMTLDTRKLNVAIREFKEENGYDPIIRINYETFLATDQLDRSNKIIDVDESHSYKQAYYTGIKVYIDNELPNGVAEVR